MKYFIDFEATQFSQEIISVGCIREDGQTFYALVAPKKGKITPFITNLTGITAEMIDSAMSADAVFSKFYDWLFENLDDAPEFLVWGNSDGDFIRHTSRHATALKAKMALGYICGNYRDYAKMCKKELKWECNHSLLNTLRRFNPSAEQNHNSLDDAVLLKEVYDFISNTSRETLDEMFADWKRKATNKESVFLLNGIRLVILLELFALLILKSELQILLLVLKLLHCGLKRTNASLTPMSISILKIR